MCAGKHSDSCGATSTTTSMSSTTTSTSSTSSPSGNDIAPLADMVNFFEGEHGRDASYYTGHSGGCLIWDSDLAQELTVVAVSTDDMYEGLACVTPPDRFLVIYNSVQPKEILSNNEFSSS